jgi:hypothetical protein
MHALTTQTNHKNNTTSPQGQSPHKPAFTQTCNPARNRPDHTNLQTQTSTHHHWHTLAELLSQHPHPRRPHKRGPNTPGAHAVDARVHYADLKQQPHQPPPTPPHTQGTRCRQTKGGPEQPDTTPTPPKIRAYQGPADSSGPNSVLDPIPHQREATSNPDPKAPDPKAQPPKPPKEELDA